MPEQTTVCPSCNGKGEQEVLDTYAGMFVTIKCTHCRGKGTVTVTYEIPAPRRINREADKLMWWDDIDPIRPPI